MRWLFVLVFSSFLCFVLCLNEQNGINNTTDTISSTLSTESGVNTTLSPPTTTITTEIKNGEVTTQPYNETSTVTKGRALNLTYPDTGNTVAGENKTRPLDDLSLDDVPMLVMHTHDTSTLPTTAQINTTTPKAGMCLDKDGKKFDTGDKFNRGCDESCECGGDGKITCKSRCEFPFYRKGMTKKDALCQEMQTDDECCVLLKCADTETEPLEGCVHKNQTFHRGEMFNDGCEAVCSCGDGGKVQCKSRCPTIANNSSDKCVPVPDPADPCCLVVLCDVTLGDHDVNKISGTEETMADSQIRLKSADALNSTSAIIHFLGEPELESNVTAEISDDQVKWNKTKLDGVMVHNLEPGNTYYIRVISGGMVSNAVVITLPKETPEIVMTTTTQVPPNSTTVKSTTTSPKDASTESSAQDEETCTFKGKNYTLGEEFNDACISYCICTENGVECSPIECPSEFGLDVLDSNCIRWETRPKDFVPTPPNCCPDHVKCLDDGSCKYKGETFPNWSEIPQTVTGCEKKCYCESGNTTCQDVCPPVSQHPPPDLPCQDQAFLHHLPGDDCCLFWVCPQIHHPETNSTTNETMKHTKKTQKPDKNKNAYLGPFNPDRVHATKSPHQNILAPFGLDEHGHATDAPLPGPIVLPYDKDTSDIPGPPYLGPNQHHKTFGFKPTKDEGIHGPPPFVVKPTKEDLDKKQIQKPKVNKTGFQPTIPPNHSEEDNEEDYDDANDEDQFQDIPHFHHAHPNPHPGRPQVIYVNHPGDLNRAPPRKPLPNEVNHPNFPQNILDLAHPGPGGPVHVYNLPPNGPKQDRRPHPTSAEIEGDEEAALHYHTHDLPDDPSVIAKEILAHLHNTENGVHDQVFGGHHESNISDFSVHRVPLNQTGFNGPLSGGFPGHSSNMNPNGVNVQVLEPLDDHTVRLAFAVPAVLVGLHGRVEVRYTATKHDQDPSTWEQQVLAPPGDLIATAQLHFELGNLLPDTTYSIMIKIILRDLANSPQSQILTVRTLPETSPVTTLPPQIPVDSGLAMAEVNSTWARLMWRKFNEFELQFIDGVQLRYREKDGKVFSATPLIHRLVTSYTIEDLKPNTSYEMGLFFIPFPGQTTELQSEKNIHVTTALENDPYKFDINLEILTTKATSVELTWSGVPYPEDKYVNIYRVIYQSETGKEDFNSFKVAKRDSTPKITIMDLKPTTRYRLWLEAYLTNGRTKKSNVMDFVSKPGGIVAAGASLQGKLSGTPPTMEPGDYYGPLVAVAILAALAIMAALILLLVLMRKHGQNKAAITSTRKTQSAYDNPSYKTCENDQSAMNGNGVSRDRSTVEDNV